MAGVMWRAVIRLDRNGDQVPVEVQAPTFFDAKQMIQMLYTNATILFGPVRVDLMRAV
jgi:hypothetical protein